MEYSKIEKVNNKIFRYNYDLGYVENIKKADSEMVRDNRMWQFLYGRNLWDVDLYGYLISHIKGCSREKWDSEESRKEFLNKWSLEIDEFGL